MYPKKLKVSKFQSQNISKLQSSKVSFSLFSRLEISKTTLWEHAFQHFKMLDSQISNNNSFSKMIWYVFVVVEVLLHKIRESKSNNWSQSDNVPKCH